MLQLGALHDDKAVFLVYDNTGRLYADWQIIAVFVNDLSTKSGVLALEKAKSIAVV